MITNEESSKLKEENQALELQLKVKNEESSKLKEENQALELQLKVKKEITEDAFRMFQQSFNSVKMLLWVYGAIIVFVVVYAGYQNYISGIFFEKEKARVIEFFAEEQSKFENLVEKERNRLINEYEIIPYRSRIKVGEKRLRSGNAEEIDSAIWFDLLEPLKAAEASHRLAEVALFYREILPLLDNEIKLQKFRKSITEVLWIYQILLRSRIDEIVKHIRETFPNNDSLDSLENKDLSMIDSVKIEIFKRSVVEIRKELGY